MAFWIPAGVYPRESGGGNDTEEWGQRVIKLHFIHAEEPYDGDPDVSLFSDHGDGAPDPAAV